MTRFSLNIHHGSNLLPIKPSQFMDALLYFSQEPLSFFAEPG